MYDPWSPTLEYPENMTDNCSCIKMNRICEIVQNLYLNSSFLTIFFSQGLPVKPHAVLPKPGQTLILEGLPGSGKTTLVRTLVTSWTAGPTHPLFEVLDLGAIRLLLHVDCSKVKDDFFQEVRTQLSLAEKILEDKLRTVLTGSEDVLLLLDGYREGNFIFDGSLMKFLCGQGGCRVLITSCPGQCPAIKEAVRPAGVLQLQTQTAMSPNSLWQIKILTKYFYYIFHTCFRCCLSPNMLQNVLSSIPVKFLINSYFASSSCILII